MRAFTDAYLDRRCDAVLGVVTRHFDVSRERLVSRDRTAAVATMRWVAMYLMVLGGASRAEAARRVNRDHSTGLHGLATIQRYIDADMAVRSTLARLASEAGLSVMFDASAFVAAGAGL